MPAAKPHDFAITAMPLLDQSLSDPIRERGLGEATRAEGTPDLDDTVGPPLGRPQRSHRQRAKSLASPHGSFRFFASTASPPPIPLAGGSTQSGPCNAGFKLPRRRDGSEPASS